MVVDGSSNIIDIGLSLIIFNLECKVKPVVVITSPGPPVRHKATSDRNFASFCCRKWLVVGLQIKETVQDSKVKGS